MQLFKYEYFVVGVTLLSGQAFFKLKKNNKLINLKVLKSIIRGRQLSLEVNHFASIAASSKGSVCSVRLRKDKLKFLTTFLDNFSYLKF